MAVGIDLTSLNSLLAQLNGLNESQKFNISNAIFLEQFATRNIKNDHPTFGQVINGNKIPILDSAADYTGFEYFDGCVLPSCQIASDWSEFKWCIKEIGCEIVICLKDLLPKFQAFFNVYRKMNDGDISDAFVQFIVEEFQKKHLNAEFRTAYLGVEGATVTITPAEGEPYDDPQPEIDGCDGFVTQMVAIADNDSTHKVSITENAGANVAAQTITDGEDIYNYLVAMYNKAATQPWFDPTKMVWRLNRSLAMTLAAWLNSKADLSGINCDCIDPSKVTGPRGFTWDNLTMLGIPVEAYDFEGAMKTQPYYYNGTKYTQFKNIIILARKDVMLLGYEDDESLHQFNVGWDERKREIFIQGSSLFGAAVSVPYFVIGY